MLTLQCKSQLYYVPHFYRVLAGPGGGGGAGQSHGVQHPRPRDIPKEGDHTATRTFLLVG